MTMDLRNEVYNPPAFACSAEGDNGVSLNDAQEGMTLLDYFAGQALAGFWADPTVEMSQEDIAESVYNMAEAMLAERGRGMNG